MFPKHPTRAYLPEKSWSPELPMESQLGSVPRRYPCSGKRWKTPLQCQKAPDGSLILGEGQASSEDTALLARGSSSSCQRRESTRRSRIFLSHNKTHVHEILFRHGDEERLRVDLDLHVHDLFRNFICTTGFREPGALRSALLL